MTGEHEPAVVQPLPCKHATRTVVIATVTTVALVGMRDGLALMANFPKWPCIVDALRLVSISVMIPCKRIPWKRYPFSSGLNCREEWQLAQTKNALLG